MRRLLLMLLIYSTTVLAEPGQLSGDARLSPGVPASTDGRFQLNAVLSSKPREPSADSAGRFALKAQMQPDSKALGGTCGPVGNEIFRNGFE